MSSTGDIIPAATGGPGLFCFDLADKPYYNLARFFLMIMDHGR